jgi:acid phosphatase (class A)
MKLRIAIAAHWQSDVEAGRVVGAASVSRLHSDPVFLAQMAEAKKEIAAARAAGRKSPLDCAAERSALAMRL